MVDALACKKDMNDLTGLTEKLVDAVLNAKDPSFNGVIRTAFTGCAISMNQAGTKTGALGVNDNGFLYEGGFRFSVKNLLGVRIDNFCFFFLGVEKPTVESALDLMKQDRSLANRVCYGYTVDTDDNITRLSSDGEERGIGRHGHFDGIEIGSNLDRAIKIVYSVLSDIGIINQDYAKELMERSDQLPTKKLLMDIILGQNKQPLLLKACVEMVIMFRKYINHDEEGITLRLNPEDQVNLDKKTRELEIRFKRQLGDAAIRDISSKQAATAQPEQQLDDLDTLLEELENQCTVQSEKSQTVVQQVAVAVAMQAKQPEQQLNDLDALLR